MKKYIYKCPKCSGTSYYEIDEKVNTGSVGGLRALDLDSVEDPMAAALMNVSYNKKLKKCKKCDLTMNESMTAEYKEKSKEQSRDVFKFFISIFVLIFGIALLGNAYGYVSERISYNNFIENDPIVKDIDKCIIDIQEKSVERYSERWEVLKSTCIDFIVHRCMTNSKNTQENFDTLFPYNRNWISKFENERAIGSTKISQNTLLAWEECNDILLYELEYREP